MEEEFDIEDVPKRAEEYDVFEDMSGEDLRRTNSFPRQSKDKEVDISFQNAIDKMRFDSMLRKMNDNCYAECKPPKPVLLVVPPEMVNRTT